MGKLTRGNVSTRLISEPFNLASGSEISNLLNY